MAIAKKPSSKPLPQADADRFVSGEGTPAVEKAAPPVASKGRVATMIRFDAALLQKVDAAAKRRGISRSAWIQYTLSEALDE